MNLASNLAVVGGLRRGIWQYLTERSRGRTRLQLEQARNAGTAQAIMLLPAGAELLETEPGGRTRILRMPPAVLETLPRCQRLDRQTVGDTGCEQ